MRFEFASAGRIIFGPGVIAEVGPLAGALGAHALVTLGTTAERAHPLFAALAAQGVSYATLPVSGEPDLDLVRRGMQQAQDDRSDLVIGFGGGSAIDAAKAIAALATSGGDPLDYLEVIGQGKAITVPPLPCVAIPTTAGTGAEVTRNAVLAAPEHRVKASLRSPRLLPRIALVDPLLTHSMPPAVTAGTGLDALTQLIEPFVSVRANPVAGAFCREGMQRAARSLRLAYDDGDNAAAREDMALASLLGGLALANAGLGAVHGIASVVGGMFDAPHGAVCARLLPHVMAANIRALRQRQPGSPALTSYLVVAMLLTHDDVQTAEEGIQWLQRLCSDLRIAPLSAYGISRGDVPTIVEKSLVASSTKANPIALTVEEMSGVVQAALAG